MLTTDQKGAIAESAIAHAALKLGIDVYRPVAEGGRYDMIFDVGLAAAARAVEVGSQARTTLSSSGAIRRGARQRGCGQRTYTAAEVDLIAAYCPDVDRCFVLGPQQLDRRRMVHLRLGAALNNQRRRVNWAIDFELGATLTALVGP